MGRAAATTRAQKAARTRRRNARRAAARATGQLIVVLVGGVVAGALALLGILPGATEPVPSPVVLGAAALAAAATFVLARRLRPSAQGRSRR